MEKAFTGTLQISTIHDILLFGKFAMLYENYYKNKFVGACVYI